MADGKLTLKQRLFVEAYLGVSKGNGTDAARKAGYKGNDNTLHTVAQENLRKPAIAAAIQEKLNAKATIMGADEVLELLTSTARGDFYEKREQLKALELLGKYHKLFTEKVEHSGEIEAKLIKIPAKMTADEWSKQKWAQPSESE